MSLPKGAKLGPYEIVAPIGAGGMGEVYKARDTRLGRTVAVKVLPSDLTASPVSRERFEREARAISQLSHGNVCALFDIGDQDGSPFLVMELLEGETLADRLKKGAFPIDQVLRHGAEICAALGQAHRQGIVHRDLKPGNVMLTKQGVKLLDFGLAQAIQPLVPEIDRAGPTVSTLTREGTIIGTPQYMAPEQIEGKPLDARSDIFALGVVLYEMVTGKPAFSGSTALALMGAVLKDIPPPVSQARADVPPSLDRLIVACLIKEPNDRVQSAHDVMVQLRWIAEDAGATKAAVPIQRGWRRPTVTAFTALALIALTIVAVRWLWPTPIAPSWTGVLLGGPEIAMGPRISPNGDTLAFLAMDGELLQVAVMKPGSGDWAILTHKRNAGYVNGISWAPDGNTIYFDRFTGGPGGVFSVPALGGDERLVLEGAFWPTALPDGSLLVGRLNAERKLRLFRFWPDSGRLLEFPMEPVQRAEVLPGGEAAVILGTAVSQTPSEGVHLHRLELTSGSVRRLPTEVQDDPIIQTIAVTRDGQSVLAAVVSGTLTRVVAIPTSGRAAPRTLLTITGPVGFLDVGPDGSIYASQQERPFTAVRFPAKGGHAEKIVTLPLGNLGAMLPDGRIVVIAFPGGHFRLMVIEAGKAPRALVPTQEETTLPITVVGPRDVAFLIGPEPRQTIALADIATGRITRRIPFDKGGIASLASSPDGQTLYVAAGGTIWSIPSSGSEKPRKVRAGDSAAVDPSGQRLLVQVVETAKTRLFDVPVNGGAEREIPLNGPFVLTGFPLNSSSITADGRLLAALASPDNYFFPPGIVDLATGTMTRIPVDHFGDYHVLLRAPDGQVIAGASDVRSALWRFQPEAVKK